MTQPKTPCSDPSPAPAGRLVVLEGMPGTGKTTAVTALADDGHQVIGEYTTPAGTTIALPDHPDTCDDDAHQANWLIKHWHITAARRHGPVVCDRDWLSALAYAASTGNPTLFRTRTRWAARHLRHGDVTVADDYVLFHADPRTSLTRRARRLTAGHPWSALPGLRLLHAFYTDPVGAVTSVNENLGRELRAATWHHLHDGTPTDVLHTIRDLIGA